MPYKTKSDLPENVKRVLPSHAQDIYKEAFNSASINIKIKKIGVMTPVVKRQRIKWPGPQ